MNLNTFASSTRDIEQCAVASALDGNPRLDEVLIEPALLARQGVLSMGKATELALSAVAHGLRPVLAWDILLPEREMAALAPQLLRWDVEPFAAIRVSDIGAAAWIRQEWPSMPIQLLVEAGSHNREALLGWCQAFGDALERLILSIELPEEKLIDYSRTLPVACEVLGAGPILLFYSPRSLLASPLRHPLRQEVDEGEDVDVWIAATAVSEHTHARQLPTIETRHGTFLFLDRDQFILDRLDGLRAGGLQTVRIDLRHLSRGDRHKDDTPGDEIHSAAQIVEICRKLRDDPKALRASWPRPTRAPFFRTNRTTAQFSRMKSQLHRYRDEACLAEVVASERNRYVAYQALQSFRVEAAQRILLPTGEERPLPRRTRFRTPAGEFVEECQADQIIITDWIGRTVPGSLLRSGSI